MPVEVFTLWLYMWFSVSVPVEVFTLWLYMPFMLLFSDIRQGIFYSVLLCFWILFAGEHLMVSICFVSYFLSSKRCGA